MRMRFLGGLCAAFALFAWMLASQSDAAAGEKSDSKVKAKASATKLTADGKQTVTITLEIEKGWHIYANPVGDDDFEPNRTRVNITAKEKVVSNVKYPPGKQKIEKIGKDEVKIKIYVDKITIQSEITRAPGDTSPLQISIDVNSCNEGTCLAPGTVKLTLP